MIRDKFAVWASNGICVEEMWNNLKNIVYECIERFVPRKIRRKIRTLNTKTRKLNVKIKGRKTSNRRKLGVHCVEELKPLSKQLLAVKKSAQEAFLKSILSKEGKYWSEFYKFVKKAKKK